MMKVFHPFHMVMYSPWPLLISMSILSMMMGLVKMFMYLQKDLFFLGLLISFIIMIVWWRDVVRESTYMGYHCSVVMDGLMLGMLLFIVSEVFFFFSFFWSFFHFSLSFDMEIGGIWPPVGVSVLNPFEVPLLNTVILLTSGISITFCHQKILSNEMNMAKMSLMMTWILGIYFLMLQMMEYNETEFNMSDSVFGSVFFMSTGFHGFHVMVGSMFLIVIWIRMINNHFSMSHFFGFEAAAWYWHFVDVVWLFLFSMVYWWGS